MTVEDTVVVVAEVLVEDWLVVIVLEELGALIDEVDTTVYLMIAQLWC